jgi:hypothetical protein
MEIFKNIIDKRQNISPKKNESVHEILENDLEKEKLLSLLPEELRNKAVRENFTIDHIKKAVEFRNLNGYKTVIGFHVSPIDLGVGEKLHVGAEGEVYFSTSLDTLYMGKGGGYIYALECSEKLMKECDKSLNWYTLKGDMVVSDKIKMTPEAIEALGAKFAQCKYS